MDVEATRRDAEIERLAIEAKAQAKQIRVRSVPSLPSGQSAGAVRYWTICICNKSPRPIRKIIPGIRKGTEKYSDALCCHGPEPIELQGTEYSNLEDNMARLLESLDAGPYVVFSFDVEVDTAEAQRPDIAVRFIDDENHEWQTGHGKPIASVTEADWQR